jgi:hypothetical protein
MNADEILYYTDGHQVVVTNSFIKVRKTLYQLRGITRHGLYIVHPPRVYQLALLVLGAVVFVCGSLNLIPTTWPKQVILFDFLISTNMLLMSMGVILFAGGMMILWMLKDKYAVRIHTAEGEKDLIVSESKEYISMIVEALNRAYLNLTKAPEKKEDRFSVSSR